MNGVGGNHVELPPAHCEKIAAIIDAQIHSDCARHRLLFLQDAMAFGISGVSSMADLLDLRISLSS
jgi:hypothetical protein